jgi:putative tricarboxylic transport membrane protein
MSSRIRSALPYAIGLAVALLLFVSASQIQYTSRPGQIGPDFWPKIAIALMAVVCVIEIVRALLGAVDAQGIAEVLEANSDEPADEPKYPRLLAGGVALVLVYAIVVSYLGFLLASFLFLAAFMYLGRYRNHLAIWSISTGMTVAIAILFIRFAYVSLPRGEPPFDRFTDLVRLLIGA